MPVDNGYSPLNPNFEKILRATEASRVESINFLEKILAIYVNKPSLGRRDIKKIRIPVMDSFKHLTDNCDDINQNWNLSDVFISQHEIAMQLHYDLCYNYFFYGQYEKAKKHILGCRENSNLLEREVCINGYGNHLTLPWNELNYASVSKEEILGYIRALNLGFELLREEASLIQKLQESVANQYTGLISILQADNLSREIPMVHRQNVELDLQGGGTGFTPSKDLVNNVSALNAVRYALDGGLPSTLPDFISKFKTVGIKFNDILFWALAPVLVSNLPEKDWENLRMFFLHLITSPCKFPIDRIDEYLKKYIGEAADVVKRKLISDEYLKQILNDPNNCDDENIDLPRELLSDDWETPDFEYKSVPELDIGRLKKKLIEASTADDIRMCLVKLAGTSPSAPLWKTSPAWKPAGNLAATLSALPRGFLQDFCYIMSGAARARAETGCARVALSLLTVIEGEARGQLAGGSDPTLYRLCRLLLWEVLLLQVNVMLAEWPHHRLNLAALSNKSKSCIAAASLGDSCVPRSQVI